MVDLLDKISEDLGVPPAWLDTAIRSAWHNYRRVHIPKRSGGKRVVYQPAVEVKMIQYWLLTSVFDRLPISSISRAFEPGSSIVSNAAAHSPSLYAVRVDLADFFPSIKFKDFDALLERSTPLLPSWANNPDLRRLVKDVCFLSEKLPIGFPSSPRIANLVMRTLDEDLHRVIQADRSSFGKAVLTRYADDFVFSSDKRGACHAFVKKIRETLQKTSSPRLKLNEGKTRFMSRLGGSTLVTGLRVKENSEVGIHPHHKSHARLMLKLYSKGQLQTENIEKLRGHLAFIRHADPALYTKWAFKFDQEMAELEAGTPRRRHLSTDSALVDKKAA